MKKSSIIILTIIFTILSCAPSKYVLIRQQLDAGDLAKADSLSRELLNDNPDDPQAYYYLGDISLRRGEIGDAVRFFKRSLEIEPSPQSHIGLADCYLQVSRLNTAQAYLDSAALCENRTANYDTIAEKLNQIIQQAEDIFNLGMEYYSQNQFRQAADEFAKAAEINTEFVDAEYYNHLSEGLLLYHHGGEDAYWQAILRFAEAAILKPYRGEPHYLMAVSYLKKNDTDFENSLRELEKALSLELSDYYRTRAESVLKETQDRKKILDEFWGRD